MNNKQLIITLVILLFFPVFAHAGIKYVQGHEDKKGGEFAAPVGIFNTKLGIASNGEFTTTGLFSRKSIFGEGDSGYFQGPSGVFDESSVEFRGSGVTDDMFEGQFSSVGMISGPGEANSVIAKGEFKSPDNGDFKFSLPK